MTTARNAEFVPENWTSGTVGSGALFVGNEGGFPSVSTCGRPDGQLSVDVLAAESDDPNLTPTRATCTQKRQLRLTNGEIVWDLSGNVQEHVNGANTLDGTGSDSMPGSVCSGVSNVFAFAGTVGSGGGACAFRLPYAYVTLGPATPGMNANNGIGYIDSFPQGGTNRVFLRGYRGIFTLSLSFGASDSSRVVGFRCAYR